MIIGNVLKNYLCEWNGRENERRGEFDQSDSILFASGRKIPAPITRLLF